MRKETARAWGVQLTTTTASSKYRRSHFRDVTKLLQDILAQHDWDQWIGFHSRRGGGDGNTSHGDEQIWTQKPSRVWVQGLLVDSQLPWYRYWNLTRTKSFGGKEWMPMSNGIDRR